MTTRSAVIDAEPRQGRHLVGDVPLTDSPNGLRHPGVFALEGAPAVGDQVDLEVPGAISISSIAWRTPIEPRSVAEDLVADFAAKYRVALVGLSIRSIVTGNIATSCSET